LKCRYRKILMPNWIKVASRVIYLKPARMDEGNTTMMRPNSRGINISSDNMFIRDLKYDMAVEI
jgi:hypothetical protein